MNLPKLGQPFSQLFDQSRFVVNSACEPSVEDAPATIIRLNANFHFGFAYLPDDPATAAVGGDYEGITPINSPGAVRLRDGAETPAVIGSRLFQDLQYLRFLETDPLSRPIFQPRLCLFGSDHVPLAFCPKEV